MALKYTSEKIKDLIKTMNSAKPYPKGYFDNVLHQEYEGNRLLATQARDLLDMYFAEHPNDKIENYM